MPAMVVYESMFGDGARIAAAVERGLSAGGLEVVVFEVGQAPHEVPGGCPLLVVGAPTHATALSRPSTRADAAGKAGGDVVSGGDGVREWLEEVSPGEPAAPFAVWDTRATGPKLVTKLDHASRTIRRSLVKSGFGAPVGEEHFFVEDMQGPLVDGEEARAQQWGRELATTLSA